MLMLNNTLEDVDIWIVIMSLGLRNLHLRCTTAMSLRGSVFDSVRYGRTSLGRMGVKPWFVLRNHILLCVHTGQRLVIDVGQAHGNDAN